jgi:hypothetical protein
LGIVKSSGACVYASHAHLVTPVQKCNCAAVP